MIHSPPSKGDVVAILTGLIIVVLIHLVVGFSRLSLLSFFRQPPLLGTVLFLFKDPCSWFRNLPLIVNLSVNNSVRASLCILWLTTSKRNFEDGLALIKDSYNYLGQEIDKSQTDSIEIKKEVIRLGYTMSTKITGLHTKAEDIGDMTGKSLHKQQLLLDGQSMALESLNSLSEFQLSIKSNGGKQKIPIAFC
ncbi:hypothetical protein PIB30_075236 [Stylosanthes scabra]|uniref:Uncharacterized protein n=1 Tax=Stylosanthes scabra TaxID=79078 RepID=A0ABU6SRI2_9FABA|nr:hypothetical protein [Stylosanthes scabra]